MSRLKLREIKQLAQGCMAKEYQKRSPGPVSLPLVTMLLTTMLHCSYRIRIRLALVCKYLWCGPPLVSSFGFVPFNSFIHDLNGNIKAHFPHKLSSWHRLETNRARYGTK